MKKRSDQEIVNFCTILFGSDSISVRQDNPEIVQVEVCQEGRYVDCSLANMLALAKFMGTLHINIDEVSYEGCETCDWGSSYEKTFMIEPDDNDETRMSDVNVRAALVMLGT
jgi:hypothetical protein